MMAAAVAAIFLVPATTALQPAALVHAPQYLAAARVSPVKLAAEAPDETDESQPALEALPKVALAGLVLTTLFHAPAFAQFADQWQQIGAAGIQGDDFWAPLQFWAFFAAMHPLLQPAIWIGEVLHGSPGPQIADVMPITFLLGNVAVIGALQVVAELRTAVNIALLALFINYVGCGLEGTKDLSDYNLALDDGVKGCPTYEQVRQPSMASFDPKLYTGRWYEHGFHDWTQFGDVYDTTLDSKLKPHPSERTRLRSSPFLFPVFSF